MSAKDLDWGDVHSDAARAEAVEAGVEAWKKGIEDVRTALDQFGNRDAMAIFFEWLTDQPGTHQGVTQEGFAEYFVEPEERDQSLIYITVNDR